ncbi:MAG TPA: cache domain-containing protein [Candidatus Omnitrophota bacterium]|nr:cache domain-containing protein [Candidatus Omnitrophota bacterium]HQO58116.1 cache domain-containing protein [Candidatus Omnitrophota bacterium]
MKAIIRLRTYIVLLLLALIVFWGVCMSLYSFFVLKTSIIGEAQKEVHLKLKTVRSVYQDYLKTMVLTFALIEKDDDIQALKNTLQLDYLYWVDRAQAPAFSSEIVRTAFREGRSLGGTRVLSAEELKKQPQDFSIPIRPLAPAAGDSDGKVLDTALGLEYARPFLGPQGQVDKVLCGGWIINKNFTLIDRINDAVFDRERYDGKRVGTVTIFQDNIRVTTNVLDDAGRRAIGTQVSAEVYHKVVEREETWSDRAFVVTDWYLTAYEPIKNIEGKIIGIFYVGILEKPFVAVQNQMFLSLLTILLLTALPTLGVSFLLTNVMIRPLTALAAKSKKIAQGDMKTPVPADSNIREVRTLTVAFDDMIEKLSEREKTLAETNDKLAVLNKRYLDLIGFVSHELKGILSSIVLNTYLLQKSILGPVNEKQSRVLKSMARNLDYLAITVKNFLNLSRIEKDEMTIDKQNVLLKEHVLESAIDTFTQQADEKKMKISCDVPEDLMIHADPGLMQIVINNLLSNAVKYGKENGEIRVRAHALDDGVEVTVYNDGMPIAEVDVQKLFKKFSRVVYRGMEKVKGTGIGLFITKEIIQRHGGTLTVEPGLDGNQFRFTIPAA